jgi:hypothetical protein
MCKSIVPFSRIAFASSGIEESGWGGNFFFVRFPNLFAICRDTFSKLCVEKRGRVEECSVASLRDKRGKTLCGCRDSIVVKALCYKPEGRGFDTR